MLFRSHGRRPEHLGVCLQSCQRRSGKLEHCEPLQYRDNQRTFRTCFVSGETTTAAAAAASTLRVSCSCGRSLRAGSLASACNGLVNCLGRWLRFSVRILVGVVPWRSMLMACPLACCSVACTYRAVRTCSVAGSSSANVLSAVPENGAF